MKEDKIKESCIESDMRERVTKIAAILEAANIHYETETDKANAIISFAKANLTYEQVKDLIKPFVY